MAGVLISRSAVEAIRSAARTAHPLEACGLLLGDGRSVVEATVAANVAPSPDKHFEIDPGHLLAMHRAARGGGPTIVGHWHSHPSGVATPSATDAAAADPDDRIWAIVAGGAIACFRAVPGGALHDRFEPVDWEIAPD